MCGEELVIWEIVEQRWVMYGKRELEVILTLCILFMVIAYKACLHLNHKIAATMNHCRTLWCLNTQNETQTPHTAINLHLFIAS